MNETLCILNDLFKIVTVFGLIVLNNIIILLDIIFKIINPLNIFKYKISEISIFDLKIDCLFQILNNNKYSLLSFVDHLISSINTYTLDDTKKCCYW